MYLSHQDVDGNKEVFRKGVSKMNGGKGKICRIIKDGDGRLALGGNEV